MRSRDGQTQTPGRTLLYQSPPERPEGHGHQSGAAQAYHPAAGIRRHPARPEPGPQKQAQAKPRDDRAAIGLGCYSPKNCETVGSTRERRPMHHQVAQSDLRPRTHSRACRKPQQSDRLLTGMFGADRRDPLPATNQVRRCSWEVPEENDHRCATFGEIPPCPGSSWSGKKDKKLKVQLP